MIQQLLVIFIPVRAMWKSKLSIVVLATLLCGLCILYAMYRGISMGSTPRSSHSHAAVYRTQLLVDTVDNQSRPMEARDIPQSHILMLGAHNQFSTQDLNGKEPFRKRAGDGSVQLDPGPDGSKPLLRILVLTYKRASSLQRCLDSLNAAEYDDLPTTVEIHIDRDKDDKVHSDTLDVARTFAFKHGHVQVFVRPRHGGVVGQWLSSWKVPQDNATEYAVFLEDDLTVSPYFSRWLRHVHEKYDSYPSINGYSLQAETIRHSVDTDYSLMEGPAGQVVFLYPVLGSWGFSPNTDRWREFIRWYWKASQDTKFLPLVPGLKSTGWYQQLSKDGRKDSMWTQWHIYHAVHNHQFTLYPHFPGKQGLAFNWKEPGEHYSSDTRGKGLKALVLDTWPHPDLVLPDRVVIVDAKGTVLPQKMTPSGLV